MLQHGPMCHEFGIRGYGDPSHGVLIVGIAPGRDEAQHTKQPFTGPSGRLLDALLSKVGWPRERVYTTNALCWWNNTPSPSDLAECSSRLHRELEWDKPKLIITAGAVANEAVMQTPRHKGSRGSVTWTPRWDAYVLDTHHPSFALQAKSMDAVQDILRDLVRIPDIVGWPPNAALARIDYRVVSSVQQAQQELLALPTDGSLVTLDIETSSTDPDVMDAFMDRLLCFAISYETQGIEQTVVFPGTLFPPCILDGSHVASWRKTSTCLKCSLTTISPLVFPNDVHWGFHAGAGDTLGIYVYFGQRLVIHEDTLLLSYCTDERPGYHKLKTLARENLAAGFYEEPVKPYYKGKMHLLPPDAVYEYNAKDSAYTRRNYPILLRRVVADQTDKLYRDLLLPATRVFSEAQARGVNVDQEKLHELAYKEWFPQYLTMDAEMKQAAQQYGWPTDDININSPQQLSKLFFRIIGLDVQKWTPNGNPSVDKEVLDALDHPFAARIRAWRALDGILDYVFAVTNNLKYDGLLHPSAFVDTTRTGRTSYRDPAMQTIPKPYTVGTDYARLREIIIPHDPATHEIIEADYNQIEVWLAWAESRDPVLLEHLQSGDVHSYTAELAFHTKHDLHTKQEWDILRQNAKKIRFGIQYGEGPEKLASPPPIGIGGTARNAAIFIASYKAGYPVYTQWMRDIQALALKQGFLRSPSGRLMRFPLVLDHKGLRQALNFPIQSTASDYNLMSMIKLAPLLRQYNSWILLNIHDALMIESDRRYRPQVMTLTRQVMEEEKFPGYPSIRVDIKVGDNLGNVRTVA